MAHRKTDVDFDDEDQYVDDGPADPSVSELDALLSSKTTDVRNLLSRGNVAAALQTALSNPPTGKSKDVDPLKERATQLVVETLATVRPTDIPAVVKELQPAHIDVLMKYLYRGMASPDLFNSALLLSWHEKAYEVGGLGSIVRVLSDGRSV
ncbi:hypothetical protein BATDEDRAFT_26639 [Batrachochytrium dendrobatidis JAM81]|uniref:Actin-related protein 2/3 complex subunit 5 n=2 Tax=Batrachochytrium dendrobatidis TaxID=109871 RepID=F4P7U9_BATDJ|nr:uncharacterized protein BATDEDRAFT_26639 [Batrachochytrium dendrobatidis JAM81]EGF78535.1 hypothetical protein BATDEDRAFT_26639 [Batrachochytrium dendrobatidis JAM81]KAJ8323944.1 arp2/3 complex subunit [Batrachochytrium dendrobatidis]KAK5664747.1 arp2/3 complex subunit [Batrachochytrium dendrobatidis]OAJ43685.1 hypothetical protein BDEG_27019 [Batrachochytrium dendrobatidis JEL423]|eukprot:XP_006680722.1 hypothetical protein BATDEDRAFT_26639 [Batrachochytrium dendrobatidis JAM81]